MKQHFLEPGDHCRIEMLDSETYLVYSGKEFVAKILRNTKSPEDLGIQFYGSCVFSNGYIQKMWGKFFAVLAESYNNMRESD